MFTVGKWASSGQAKFAIISRAITNQQSILLIEQMEQLVSAIENSLYDVHNYLHQSNLSIKHQYIGQAN